MMDDAKKLTAWGMDDGVHDALSLKPITTPEQQIDLLKGKGVTFERCAEERAVRAWLVSDAAERGEDGYGIVADFVSSLPRGFREGLRRDLVSRSQADEYAGSLIDHYRDAMPVWVLLEVVPFGTLLAFYLFCVERWDETGRREIHYALKDVKAVRNCASHSLCA